MIRSGPEVGDVATVRELDEEAEWGAHDNHVQLRLGLGAFGVVYKATVRGGSNFEITTRTMLGEWHNSFSAMTVAVKILHLDDHGDYEGDICLQFVKEVVIIIIIFSVMLHSHLPLD